jgi:PAS domain-containing protein
MGSGLEWANSPNDLKANGDAWTNAVLSGTVYEIAHRIRMKDGSYRWHLSRSFPQYNELGEVIKWYGTATDIHEQRTFSEHLEELVAERTRELQRSNEDLQQFAT